MNVNSELFVPATELKPQVEKENEANKLTPDDFTEHADEVISKKVGVKVPKRSSKEQKAMVVKDLTSLIDRLLEDGTLCEKMTLDD